VRVSIHVDDLTKRLGRTQALDGVTTRFETGLMHGVIGPEGAGKTTLFRHLVGLLRPNSGSLRYFDSGQPTTLEAVRPNLAYMPQQQSLYPDLSIEEHLEFFRELHGLSDAEYIEKRDRLLHLTRLEKFRDRPAGQLSGGMYKKLGLMCALVSSPSVLLLDEPTNGVDPISRREFWELLYHLSEQNILIVIATAYMDEAERCARVHLMDAGKLIGAGEPRALMEQEKVRSFDEYFLRRSADRSRDA